MKKTLNSLKFNFFFFKINYIIIFLLFLNFFLRIFKEFSSVDNIYMIFNFFFLNKDYFVEDIFLNHSVIIKNDFYYKILSLLKLNIDHDIHGLILHVFSSIFSCFFIFLTIKKIFSKFSYQINLLIILIFAAGKSSFLLDGVMSNLLISHSSTPTALSSSLNFAFIYFLLSKSIAGVIISSSVSFLISVKVGWFPLGICICYLIFFEKRYFLSFLPIVIFLLTLLKNTNVDTSVSENLELYKFAYNREFYATMFTKQSIFRLILFCFSFFVFYKISRNIIKKDKQPIINLLIFLQVLSFLFFIIIETLDLNILKRWQFVAISPVRSTAIYEILFKLVILIYLFKYLLNLKNSYIFLFFVLAIYFFQFGKNTNYLSLFFFVICLSFIIFNNFNKFYIKQNFSILISLFLITISSIYLFVKDFKRTITFNFFNHEKRFFLKELTKEKYYALKKYRYCKDFLFYDTTGNFYASAYDNSLELSHIKNWSSNSIIKKSPFFIETAFLYGNLNLLKLNENNYELIKELYYLVKKKDKMNSNLHNKFKDRKLVLLIKNESVNLFKNSYEIININNLYSLVLINYSLDNFIYNCDN